MAMRFYVSTANAPFFVENVMGYGESVPVTGSHKVGDFIISSTQADGVFGWVCTVAGTPGEWSVIGSGVNNSGPIKLTGFTNLVEFNDTRGTIDIGIPDFDVTSDFLEVHYNGLLLAENVHYELNSSGNAINNINGQWNTGGYPGQQMLFKVIKGTQGSGHLVQIKKVININTPLLEVSTGISNYNPGLDFMEVHLNGVLLMEGLDYKYESGKLIKLDTSESWNPNGVNGQKMFVRVLKNEGEEIPDGCITMNKLSSDVIDLLNQTEDTRIGNMSELTTTHKDSVVTAINEIKSISDLAKQRGDDVKNMLVDKLISVGTEASTTEEFETLINKVQGESHKTLPVWYDPSDTYVEGANAPVEVDSPSASYVNGKIYLLGGYKSVANNKNNCYDTKSNKWVTKADMPTAKYNHRSCAIGNHIYVIGGSSALASNECYDILTDTWSTKANMPTGRNSFGISCVGDSIYAIGGHNGSYCTQNECYDTITDSWTTKASLAVGRAYVVSEVIEDKIYIIGGFNEINKNECYDTKTDTWVGKANMTTGRVNMGSGLVNGKIYTIGGMYNSNCYRNNECYDPETDKWTKCNQLSMAISSPASVTVGGCIYILCGITDGSGVKTAIDKNIVYIP